MHVHKIEKKYRQDWGTTKPWDRYMDYAFLQDDMHKRPIALYTKRRNVPVLLGHIYRADFGIDKLTAALHTYPNALPLPICEGYKKLNLDSIQEHDVVTPALSVPQEVFQTARTLAVVDDPYSIENAVRLCAFNRMIHFFQLIGAVNTQTRPVLEAEDAQTIRMLVQEHKLDYKLWEGVRHKHNQGSFEFDTWSGHEDRGTEEIKQIILDQFVDTLCIVQGTFPDFVTRPPAPLRRRARMITG